jgi:hypothetical protein
MPTRPTEFCYGIKNDNGVTSQTKASNWERDELMVIAPLFVPSCDESETRLVFSVGREQERSASEARSSMIRTSFASVRFVVRGSQWRAGAREDKPVTLH